MNPNFRQLAGGKPILAISKSGLKEVSGGGGRGEGLQLRASELQVQRSNELLGHAATANWGQHFTNIT